MVASENPDKASDAARIVDSLMSVDAKPPGILVQLRDGELALLDLWTLVCQRS
jgi:hypothetical protein